MSGKQGWCNSIQSELARLCILTNTLKPKQNGRCFAENIFKFIFCWESFVSKGPFDYKLTLFQVLAWRR